MLQRKHNHVSATPSSPSQQAHLSLAEYTESCAALAVISSESADTASSTFKTTFGVSTLTLVPVSSSSDSSQPSLQLASSSPTTAVKSGTATSELATIATSTAGQATASVNSKSISNPTKVASGVVGASATPSAAKASRAERTVVLGGLFGVVLVGVIVVHNL